MLVDKLYQENLFPLMLGLLVSSDNLDTLETYNKHISTLEDMLKELSDSTIIPVEDKEKYTIKINECLSILNKEKDSFN